MSLINEALKKAQRQRHEGATDSAPGAIVKRAQPKSARSMLLLVVGAAVLIVASMVATALWVTRTPHTTPSNQPTLATAAAPKVPATSPAPAVATAGITLALPIENRGDKGTSGAVTGSALSENASDGTASVGHTTAHLVPATSLPPPAKITLITPPKPDERIVQFVDSLKVPGVRSSGSESKVLINDRMYRVNDIVDRTLGLRLTKVSPDSLTFTDANGVVYVRNF